MNSRADRPKLPWPTLVVTGATSGVGLALAKRLAAGGHKVVALGRSAERLRELEREHPSIHGIALDLADPAALGAVARRIAAEHPDAACLVNNAGIQFTGVFDEQDEAAIRREIETNLTAPIVLTRALLPHLAAQPAAAVVNITSALAYVPKRTAAVYSATKAGLHLFTQALRVQWRDRTQGVPGGDRTLRAIEIVLPLVDTPMTAGRGRGKITPVAAAQAIVEALGAGRDDIRVGKAAALSALLRVAPGLAARLVQRSD